jgi:hypothetical protein
MAKKIKQQEPLCDYKPRPDNVFYFYIGEKYYRRLQPVPYRYLAPDIKRLKKLLDIK